MEGLTGEFPLASRTIAVEGLNKTLISYSMTSVFREISFQSFRKSKIEGISTQYPKRKINEGGGVWIPQYRARWWEIFPRVHVITQSINQACIRQELNLVAFIWWMGVLALAQQPCYNQGLQKHQAGKGGFPCGETDAYMSRWEVWPGDHRFVTESSIYFERMTVIASNKWGIRCSTTSLCMETEFD